ncbi:MAG: thioredoxin family protein [Nitrososphaerota archaeon]|nr:thioredoxin family protein [Nitrososphaerota archaeon]
MKLALFSILITMDIVDNKRVLFLEQIKAKRVLVLFYATWCPHCTRFIPVFREKTIDCNFNIVQMCMDDYDNPLWDDYKIDAVPTVILFENGKVSSRLDSRQGNSIRIEDFVTWLQEVKRL